MALAFQPTTFNDQTFGHAPAQIPAPVREHPSLARARAATMYRRRRIGFALAAVVFAYGLWSLALGVVQIAGAAPGQDFSGSITTPSANGQIAVTAVHTPDVSSVSLHVVQPGETLWSIAGGLGSTGDLRETVDQIAQLNGGRTTLRPGQRLVLPAG